MNNTTQFDLPDADPVSARHAERVAQYVRDKLTECGGWIGFDVYLEAVLYTPGLGYYSAGARKFGEAGDFITAPELSTLFSQCVARQCAEVLASSGGGIVELGAGTGQMAVDILRTLDQLGQLPEYYWILERSADLRVRQQQLLAQNMPEYLPKIKWLEALPEQPVRGVIVGNEVLDALPFKRFEKGQSGWLELGVSLADEQFVWHTQPADRAMSDRLTQIENDLAAPLPEGYRSEICTGLSAWQSSLAACLERGVMLWLDYGMPRSEYYAADRHEGTFLCHYRHRAHDDPFRLLGIQDITAQVDFTAVAEAGVDSGLDLLGYTTQAFFLMGLDIQQALLDETNEDRKLRLAQQIKQLTLPSEMGERFQVIALSRQIDAPLSGFTIRDLSHRL